jgi:hypothetical protein
MRTTLITLLILTSLWLAPQSWPAQDASSPTTKNQQKISGVLMDAGCQAIASIRRAGQRDKEGKASRQSDYAPARSTTEAGPPKSGRGGNDDAIARGGGSTTPVDSSSFTTVREKYRDCMVKPTTASFAIHSDGRLIMLDDADHEVIRQQLASDEFRDRMTDAAGNPKWTSVTLSGSMHGGRFRVTSVRK